MKRRVCIESKLTRRRRCACRRVDVWPGSRTGSVLEDKPLDVEHAGVDLRLGLFLFLRRYLLLGIVVATARGFELVDAKQLHGARRILSLRALPACGADSARPKHRAARASTILHKNTSRKARASASARARARARRKHTEDRVGVLATHSLLLQLFVCAELHALVRGGVLVRDRQRLVVHHACLLQLPRLLQPATDSRAHRTGAIVTDQHSRDHGGKEGGGDGSTGVRCTVPANTKS